jgi:hypothetical protein
MLNTSKLMAFVGTTDSARVKAFYEGVPGLTLVSDESFALVFDAHGTMLRVQKLRALPPAAYTALGWEVTDLHGMVEGLA